MQPMPEVSAKQTDAVSVYEDKPFDGSLSSSPSWERRRCMEFQGLAHHTSQE